MSDVRTLTYRLVAGTSIALSLLVSGSFAGRTTEAAPSPDVNYAAAVPADFAPAVPETIWLAGTEQQMLAEHNRLRAAVGAPPLVIDPQLEHLARERATDMVVRNYFSHTTPSGQTVFDMMDAEGFRAYSSAENIASNNYPVEQSVTTAMNGFMNSTGHRESLLNSSYTRVGIGYDVTSSGMHYFAVVFATP